MNPLRVALLVKGSASNYDRSTRNMGWWSYAVPEFTWEHFHLGESFREHRRRFQDFDLIFIEDGGNYGEFTGDGPPVAYMVIDSTLSETHYRARLAQAGKSDLVLVDHDRLSHFRATGKPVRRLAYCVNDQVFKPLEKTLDVSFHCGTGARKGMPGGVERNEIRRHLHDICQANRWTYRSGALGFLEYAESMGRSKVIVNWPRTPINRPHRVFDAMAAGACLVTGRLPYIEEDYLVPGVHYLAFDKIEDIHIRLYFELVQDHWERIALAGRELVKEKHTWKIRAGELRQILAKELGL